MEIITNNLKFWSNKKNKEPEISKSQYSLVYCGDVSPAAVELWQGLPEEVKFDPALAAFKQQSENNDREQELLHEKESSSPKKLHLVSSAPLLRNILQPANKEYSLVYNNNDRGIEIHTATTPLEKEESTEQQKPIEVTKKPSNVSKAGHLSKLTLLVACWMFFTAVFMMYNEKEEPLMHTTVIPGQIKAYKLETTEESANFLIKLTGPFLTKHQAMRLNTSEYSERPKFHVWLKQVLVNNSGEDDTVMSIDTSEKWTLILDEENLDFIEGETLTSVLSIANATTLGLKEYSLYLQSEAQEPIPVNLRFKINPLDPSVGVIYSCILLCGLYVLIIFEVINRTMAGVIVSTTSLAVLTMLGERPSIEELVSWLDIETLLLLFSMMLLVAIMAETGMFDYLAVYTFQITRGKIWYLINLLSAITGFLSTFLDNVTTVLLMAPVTIRLCEVTDLDPIPILISMVMYSNIGGAATPVGDPPNVIIASNKDVIAAGINFTNFTLHMALGVLFVSIQTGLQIKWFYRDTKNLRMKVPSDILELRQQISVWKRAADSLPYSNREGIVVKETLEKKVKSLNVQLEQIIKERGTRACPKDTFRKTLREMKEKYKIRDKVLLVKASIAVAFAVIVFFLHAIPELNRISLGWTALLAAILLLILADREDIEPVLHRVEWSTLLFFASLFVLMEALAKLGLIEFIGGLTERLIMNVDESARLAVALLLLLWVSGITSAFVDNIPLTTMMIRIVTSLGNNPSLGLPLAPMVWALCFGGSLGGNGTLIGASSNVVCAGVAEQHGYKFTFMQFFKFGFPIMIGHLIVASVYLLICHCVFTWH